MIAPSDSDLADQTQARLSVLFTLVYDLWKCDPSAVMHFIMIYARTIHRECGRLNASTHNPMLFPHAAFSSPLMFAILTAGISLVNVYIHIQN